MSLWHRITPTKLRCLPRRCRSLHSLLPRPAAASLADTAGLRQRLYTLENPLGSLPAISGSSFFRFAPARSFAAPVQAKPKAKEDGPKGPRLNGAITARFVRLVTDEGHNVISRWEALEHAKKLNLDLVEVDRMENPPACKIMDYHKEKYVQEQKEKERAKIRASSSLRSGENKEVRVKAKTELKDLKIKADGITRLMDRGYRVKLTALGTGKGEEDMGGLLCQVLTLIQDVAVVESGPHLTTIQAFVVIRHVKYEKKKTGKKISEVIDGIKSGVYKVIDPEAEGEAEEEVDPGNDDDRSEYDAEVPSTPIRFLKGKLELKKEPTQPEPSTNRYSKPSEAKAPNKARTPQPIIRNDLDRCGPLDPNQRWVQSGKPSSPPPRFGNFVSQGKPTDRSSVIPDNRAGPNQGRLPLPPAGSERGGSGQSGPDQRWVKPSNPYPLGTAESGDGTKYGIFSKAKPAVSVNEKNVGEKALPGEGSPKPSYGIFSSSKPTW